jgi:CMP-N-acetylneuraminic acid synthetase
MEYIFIIPARGGSKGIKKKNLQKIGDKSLIEYSFDAAKGANISDDIYLTSDDKEMIDLAISSSIKAPFIRPIEYSTDTATMFDVVKHLLDWIKNEHGEYPKNFILLQPTSPFRDANDVIEAIKIYENSNKNSLISATEVTQHPFEMFHIDDTGLDFFYKKNDTIISKNRQEYKKVYFEDGSIYICDVEWFL